MQEPARWDHDLIFEIIPPAAPVLDLGCGCGELLARLQEEKAVRGQGVEADPGKVAAAVARGVPVYQGDLDHGLSWIGNKSWEYVVLEKTLQVLRRPETVLSEMLRIGRRCIVSFPNFNHRRVVDNLLRRERMPVSPALPHRWCDTPDIHPLTLYDFLDWTRQKKVTVEAGYAWSEGRRRPLALPDDSLLAEELLFVLF